MQWIVSTIGAAVALAGLSAAPAHAQNWYVEGSAGVTDAGNLDWGGSSYSTDTGWNAAVAVGSSVWSNWDLEGELSYDRVEYSCCNPNNTHEYRLMANLTRNFNAGAFTPYVGAGVGVAQVTYDPSSLSDTVGAYQIIGGVRVPMGASWSIYGEYRYQNTFSDPKDSGLEWEHHGNNFAFGVRWAM